MTNRPNLTEEEKEHYNKVAMDMIYKSKTPRTDAFFNRTDITWDDEVKFAQDLEIELNQLKNELTKQAQELDNTEILKKMNTKESKEGVKKFFNKSLCNSKSN
jgi:hypothetical protein